MTIKRSFSILSSIMNEIAIRAELDRILKSRHMAKSPAMASFLTYVVEETLAGRAKETVKAYTIAVEALGKDEDFDPQNNSSVRMLANRLRHALDAYYAQDGADVPVVISLPKGGYIPVFEFRATDNGSRTHVPRKKNKHPPWNAEHSSRPWKP